MTHVPATIITNKIHVSACYYCAKAGLHNNFLHVPQDGCCVRFAASHLGKLMRYFIAYKRLPGPMTLKTLVSIPVLYTHCLTFSQTNPKAKIISMTMVFGRQ